MERKESFIKGQRYHIFTRSVEKRVAFKSSYDYKHFQLLLLLSNNEAKVHLANLRNKYKGKTLLRVVAEQQREPLVHINAYAIMPNHIHLLIEEIRENGISKFMLKLMTAYSMYFNIKYERSGPLFARPFRSRHVDTDEYFRWVFAYITLNPLQLFQNNWKEVGIRDLMQAKKFMRNYPYSSFWDYFMEDRSESRILHKEEVFHAASSFDHLIASLTTIPSIKGTP